MKRLLFILCLVITSTCFAEPLDRPIGTDLVQELTYNKIDLDHIITNPDNLSDFELFVAPTDQNVLALVTWLSTKLGVKAMYSKDKQGGLYFTWNLPNNKVYTKVELTVTPTTETTGGIHLIFI